MFEKLMRYIDYIAIPLGIIALFLSFADIDNYYLRWVIGAADCFALLYIFYAIYLFWERPKFDWHLLNGHFLRKVCCLIILTPFILTSIANVFIVSPKEMVYDSNLYECNDNELSCTIKERQENPNLFWSTYYHFVDPGNQHMTTTKEGRICSAVIAILGVFLLNGLLVSSIIGWVDRRKEEVTKGNIRYKRRHLGKNRFAIVFGANEIAASVIRDLFTPRRKDEINYRSEGDNRFVIMQTSRDAEEVRTELASHLSDKDLKRVIIYKAQRDSAKEIRELHVRYSTEIYVLGESTSTNNSEPYHDAINMRCVNLIANELKKTKSPNLQNVRSNRKVCKVLFEYQTTYSMFQFSDISEDVNSNLVFIPFNRYEAWARKVMVDNITLRDISTEESVSTSSNASENGNDNKYIRYTPLDGDGIKADDDTHVHLVIVGMSNMGIAMGVQAMLQAHYLNYASAEKKQITKWKDARRTRITFIDTNADREMAFFKGRYASLFSLTKNRYLDAKQCNDMYLKADSNYRWNNPGSEWEHLSEDKKNFMDIEIEFIKGEIESDKIRRYLQNISDNTDKWVKNSRLTIAICMTQTHQAIAASLYMPISVYEKVQEIWVYQRESDDIINNLHYTKQEDKRYKKLKPFGMLYGEYISDRRLYLKALFANGAYDLDGQSYKMERRNITDKKTYADIRATWKELTLDKKFSNKYFVDSIPQRLRSIGNPSSYEERKKGLGDYEEELAICEHNRWNVQQLLLGYSPCNKDDDMKFQNLNSKKNTVEAENEYKKWKEHVDWNNLSPIEKIKKKAENAVNYHTTTYGIFDNVKKEYKNGEHRKHPNICSYGHLDKVDSGAKSYDKYLNNAIPDILNIVSKNNIKP